jgi:outer membrane protein assembly factor BamB
VAGNKINFSPNGTGVANAFRADTGAPLWPNAATFPSPITSTPVLSEAQSLVYVQSTAGFGGRDWTGNLLYALDSTTGALDWSALPAGNPPQPPQVQPCPNGTDWYYNGGSPAYDDTQPSIGPVLVSVARIQYIIPCSPAWVQFKNSILTAYNAKNKANGGGTVVWTQDIGHSISYSSPSISNGVVYVGTDDGYVLAFDELTGNPIWTSPQMVDGNGHPDPILGPPAISLNRIHIVTQSGTLYVYGLPGY